MIDFEYFKIFMKRGMSMKKYAIVLAAGQGTRMKSKLHKVLHKVCGKPMIEHAIDLVATQNVETTVTIVGHGAEAVKEAVGNKTEYVLQEQQLGTAHAVLQAAPLLSDKKGTTIVLCGDTAFFSKETLAKLLDTHNQANAKATILTAVAPDSTGYGRIVRDENGAVQKIVEHKDCTAEQLAIQEINSATYCFDNQALFETLQLIDNRNSQNEFYLTDIIEILKNNQQVVTAYCTPDFAETCGVNDRVQLAQVEKAVQKRINEEHMRGGVTIIDPMSTYIAADVIIGNDTVIYPGTTIAGNVKIGSQCVIGPNTEINNCEIGEKSVVRHSAVFDSKIGADAQIGPFAHIRPASQIADKVKIGNFVEVKASEIDEGSKVSHLSYIGDTKMGSHVNVGCGTITVNYDGQQKHLTTIGDGAFIGCNANLIAPVTIGEDALIAAGSTITKDVEADDLSIARAEQVNKKGYARKFLVKKDRK